MRRSFKYVGVVTAVLAVTLTGGVAWAQCDLEAIGADFAAAEALDFLGVIEATDNGDDTFTIDISGTGMGGIQDLWIAFADDCVTDITSWCAFDGGETVFTIPTECFDDIANDAPLAAITGIWFAADFGDFGTDSLVVFEIPPPAAGPPPAVDADGDGLIDAELEEDADGVEDATGTCDTDACCDADASCSSPADYDGDGINDGIEFALGTDPKDAGLSPPISPVMGFVGLGVLSLSVLAGRAVLVRRKK